MITKVLVHSFRTELSEKHDFDDALFFVDGSYLLQDACQRHSFGFRYENMEIGILSNVSLER